MNNPSSAVQPTSGFVPKQLIVQIGSDASKSGETLPVNVNQQISPSGPVDSITLIEIMPDWNVTDTNTHDFSIVDANNKSAIRVGEPIVHEAALARLKVNCGVGDDRVALFPRPITVRLASDTNGDLLIKYSLTGLNPKADGTYELKFASVYPTKVVLPQNADITTNHSAECNGQYEDFGKIFVYDMVFRLR
ncbi:hypothetical protein [Nitrososphaera viennensis]|mgnify:CR=1 FL=1|uniref:Uncharacterized protein n=2 Tax=Nitrososphaera viennensis TaxID=1034015 RepID=A0A060HFR7_9ARCH|nr:hypothetical protein [Nitrososphaera viennensis]AIC15439.1 hypothetical protein NVIE_012060 [Nitrososphaera viennensis EN76]UVS70330.1 hypothetical protein NWT39_05970 [Nitrososphaera viennensis]